MYQHFATLYDRFMREVDYDAWTHYLREIFSRFGKAGAHAVLDAACGTGNISITLAQVGYHVTSSDISGDMLRLAAEKTRRLGLCIPFVQQDLRSILLHKPVDIVNCACDGVNYLKEDADVQRFFNSAFTVLSDGGLLCFDISSTYKLQTILDGRTFGEDDGDAAYLWQNVFEPDTGLLYMDLTFFEQKENGLFERFCEQHIQRAHTSAQLIKYLKEAGFDAQVFEFGGFQPERADSERLQFVAAKV